jgi:hypothetical protein
VEVNWTSGNTGDVQRGHWSFTNNSFAANDSTTVLDFWNYTSQELDVTPSFINAVRIVTRRSSAGTPLASFFARILGYNQFEMSAEAVAYLGFTGSVSPTDIDKSIGICKQAILGEDGSVSCNIGRMINSGSNNTTNNTAGWSNLSQPCGTASNSWMSSLICSDFSTRNDLKDLNFGQGIGATGGNLASIMRDLQDCWVTASNKVYDTNGNVTNTVVLDSNGDGIPEHPWVLNLPVIDCPGNNVSNCATFIGVVRVKMIWILDNQNSNQLSSVSTGPSGANEVPYQMYYDPDTIDTVANANDPALSWNANTLTSTYTASFAAAFPSQSYNKDNPSHRWWYFVSAFNLKNSTGATAPYQNMAMYFMPICDYGKQKGNTQGNNYGILAKIPALVR